MAVRSKALMITIVGVVAVLAAASVAWVFLCPSRSADLQKAHIQRRDYDQSVKDIQKVIAKCVQNLVQSSKLTARKPRGR